jgi:hypothetical protein
MRNFKSYPAQPNNVWLNKTEIDVTKYIDRNSKPTDGLFDMDLEPMYYFLTNRPNPTRFYISWFADPQPYTNEALASLKKNPPKFIIYTGQIEDSDNVLINNRIPDITNWVLKNYTIKKVIDKDTVILSRH